MASPTSGHWARAPLKEFRTLLAALEPTEAGRIKALQICRHAWLHKAQDELLDERHWRFIGRSSIRPTTADGWLANPLMAAVSSNPVGSDWLSSAIALIDGMIDRTGTEWATLRPVEKFIVIYFLELPRDELRLDREISAQVKPRKGTKASRHDIARLIAAGVLRRPPPAPGTKSTRQGSSLVLEMLANVDPDVLSGAHPSWRQG